MPFINKNFLNNQDFYINAECYNFPMDLSTQEYKIDKQTSETINIVKFLAIIFVLCIHSYKTTFYLGSEIINLDMPIWLEMLQFSISNVFCEVSLPLFFFFSGLLLFKKNFSYKENLKKKSKKLLIPYVVFTTLAIFIFMILEKIPQLNFLTSKSFFISEWNIQDYTNAYTGYVQGFPLVYPLWFIKNLFIVNIFSYPIKFLIKKYGIKFLASIGIIYTLSLIIQPNYKFVQPIMTLFYFSIGGYFAINQINFDSIKEFVKKTKLVVVYFIAFLAKLILYYQKVYSLFLTAILSTICFFCIIGLFYKSRESKIKNLFLKLSKYTFPIFLLHEYSLTFLKKFLIHTLPITPQYILLEYFLCPIAILVFCIFLAKIINKLFPKLYLFLFGEK